MTTTCKHTSMLVEPVIFKGQPVTEYTYTCADCGIPIWPDPRALPKGEWSKEKPNRSGWYWKYSPNNKDTEMVRILSDHLGRFYISIDDWNFYITEFSSNYWFGPVEPPLPPEGENYD